MGINRLCVLIVILTVNSSAQAQGTVGELKEILSRTQLLIAAKALLEAERAFEALGPTVTTPANEDNAAATVATGKSVVPYPTVRGVYGSAGVRWATLSYATGDIRDAKSGDFVDSKCRLHEVTVSRVTMKCADDIVDLTFSEFAPALPISKPLLGTQKPNLHRVGPTSSVGQANPASAF